MKNTNEIEKQLQQKADKYLNKKAEEMFMQVQLATFQLMVILILV